MTSIERLIAAVKGAEVDRKPQIGWLAADQAVDASVAAQSDARNGPDEPVLLAEVPNPFGLALQRGIDLNKALKDDPSVGAEILDGLVEEVRDGIVNSLSKGADGIFYRLHGACPAHCSPMQYGGHYLERDRELLSGASNAVLNVLFVVGKEDLYIDFVSDLPAHVFAWDSDLSSLRAGDVRCCRSGALACGDPDGDIGLLIGRQDYLEKLERPNSE